VQWLLPVIPDNWEEEIQRIKAKPSQKKFSRPILTNKKLSMTVRGLSYQLHEKLK
jgi:hypothetical protein